MGLLIEKENDRKISLRYNEDMDSFDENRSRMKGGKCVMAHRDAKNDIEAAGRKLQIRNSTIVFLVFTKVPTTSKFKIANKAWI